MNTVRQIQELNRKELEAGISPEASWHTDYRDTAYIYIGNLHLDLSEGDITTMFSQFGEPVHVHLIRDKETGKSKGFAFLKYEDQRSTDLAVDNLGGATVLGRTLKIDHTRYKKKEEQNSDKVDRSPQTVGNHGGFGDRAAHRSEDGYKDGARTKETVANRIRDTSRERDTGRRRYLNHVARPEHGDRHRSRSRQRSREREPKRNRVRDPSPDSSDGVRSKAADFSQSDRRHHHK